MSTFTRTIALASLAATAAALLPAVASAAAASDLAAYASYDQGVRTPGSVISQTVGVANLGGTARRVRVTAALPAGVEYRRGTGGNAAYPFDCSASTRSTVDCSLTGDLPPVADSSKWPSLQLTLRVTKKAAAGQSAVSFVAHSATPDADHSNDAATVSVPIATTFGTITGRVWDDRNHNGIQDRGEHGLAGHNVVLWQVPWADPSTYTSLAVTDKNGRYTFGHVPAYTYLLNLNTEDLRLTPVGMGTDKTKDSDFDPNNAMENWAQSHEFTVAAKARVAVDAGLVAQQ